MGRVTIVMSHIRGLITPLQNSPPPKKKNKKHKAFSHKGSSTGLLGGSLGGSSIGGLSARQASFWGV